MHRCPIRKCGKTARTFDRLVNHYLHEHPPRQGERWKYRADVETLLMGKATKIPGEHHNGTLQQ